MGDTKRRFVYVVLIQFVAAVGVAVGAPMLLPLVGILTIFLAFVASSPPKKPTLWDEITAGETNPEVLALHAAFVREREPDVARFEQRVERVLRGDGPPSVPRVPYGTPIPGPHGIPRAYVNNISASAYKRYSIEQKRALLEWKWDMRWP